MPIQISSDIEERLGQIAAARQCSPEALANEILDEYSNHIEQLTADVLEAEESAERDGWVPHEEVVARLQQRFKKSA